VNPLWAKTGAVPASRIAQIREVYRYFRIRFDCESILSILTENAKRLISRKFITEREINDQQILNVIDNRKIACFALAVAFVLFYG